MGPCRLVKPGQRGVCGATLETVAARNLARGIAAGAAAHSDHGLEMAFTLEAVAKGEAPGYTVRDPVKLRNVAGWMGLKTDGRPVNELALDVAQCAIENFRQLRGELTYVSRAPLKRQAVWRRLGITLRSITREIVETLHRTHMGTDQDAEHILRHALRTALSDGWGGSMLATDLSDILFGTPSPTVAQVNLGVLDQDQVNIVIHGHEPTLSEMVVAAAREPELIEYACAHGAAGINLCGLCCTANEILMRQGVSVAGNFLSQELAVLTGAVEAMVVDVQCIMQALGDLSARFHTKLITTSPKADITGATHIEFDEHRAPEIARQIVRLAIDNFPHRNGQVVIPAITNDLVPGFSHEYINYMLGGTFRGVLPAAQRRGDGRPDPGRGRRGQTGSARPPTDTERRSTPFAKPPDLKGMLALDLEMELGDIDSYQKHARLAEALGAVELKVRLEEMAADEAGHAPVAASIAGHVGRRPKAGRTLASGKGRIPHDYRGRGLPRRPAGAAGSHFGRCACFVLVDTDTHEWRALPNPAEGLASSAGLCAALYVVAQGVEAVISGDIGPNAAALRSAGIRLCLAGEGAVGTRVDDCLAGRLAELYTVSWATHPRAPRPEVSRDRAGRK
jgi:predicted Fe-Mo cluster-binding NifX family protein